jgi:hypothetical protein
MKPPLWKRQRYFLNYFSNEAVSAKDLLVRFIFISYDILP